MLIELLLAVLAGSLLQGVALMIARRLARRSEPGTDALDLPATRRDLAELDLRCAGQVDRMGVENVNAIIAEQFRITGDAQRSNEAIHARIAATNVDLGRISDDAVSIRAQASAMSAEIGRALGERDRDAARDREKRRALEDALARLMERADLLDAATFAALPDWRCAWRDCGAVPSRWAWRRDAKGVRRVEARCQAHERGDAFTVPFFDPAYNALPYGVPGWLSGLDPMEAVMGSTLAATLSRDVIDDAVRRFEATRGVPCTEPECMAPAVPGSTDMRCAKHLRDKAKP